MGSFVCILANPYPLALKQYHRKGREATSHSDFDLRLCQCSFSCLSVPTLVFCSDTGEGMCKHFPFICWCNAWRCPRWGRVLERPGARDKGDALLISGLLSALPVLCFWPHTVLTPASSRATLVASTVPSQHLGQLPSQSGQH